MRRDVLRKLERSIQPEKIYCVHIRERGWPTDTIHCDHFNTDLSVGACPGFNGNECPYSHQFIKGQYVRVEAGPRGEIVELSPVEHELEED